MSTAWIKPMTEAGQAAYPIPIFLNYVNGSLEAGIIGGSPGEDVRTYLEDCPDLSFIAVNSYFCAKWHGDRCESPSQGATGELRAVLQQYATSRNVPAVTETNSGDSAVAPRFAYIALGEFGAPIFAPWALTMSYPESNEPYVLHDGRLADGAYELQGAYQSLDVYKRQTIDSPYCAAGNITALGGPYGFYDDYVYPGWWGLSSSVYNGLQTTFDRRYSNGFALLSTLTRCV